MTDFKLTLKDGERTLLRVSGVFPLTRSNVRSPSLRVSLKSVMTRGGHSLEARIADGGGHRGAVKLAALNAHRPAEAGRVLGGFSAPRAAVVIRAAGRRGSLRRLDGL